VLAGNGVGRAFGTFFKHAGTFKKVFVVGHASSNRLMIWVCCLAPQALPAQMIVCRPDKASNLYPLAQGFIQGLEGMTS
jgi:hypothetical protein